MPHNDLRAREKGSISLPLCHSHPHPARHPVRAGLRLFDFTCAWFDDRHYFEFYPLHVVHKRGTRRRYR